MYSLRSAASIRFVILICNSSWSELRFTRTNILAWTLDMDRLMRFFLLIFVLCSAAGLSDRLLAVYTESPHRLLAGSEIAVEGPGCYAEPGKTYMLTRDIAAQGSAVFLGKDVTLDLNGYTITFADGQYSHVPNYGFEEGLEGWDVSKAPGAKVEDTETVHVFIGEKILSLAAGDEIVSGWVELPLAERSYFAMCGVTMTEMRVSLYVENGEGRSVRCVQDYGDSSRVSCPVERRGVRLGGGFVTAHLFGLPAGKYRVRVRAETACQVDEIDIRPAMDTGIAVVENTFPWAHTDNLYAGNYCAFYDYTIKGSASEPLPSIPRVSGPGTVTIRNGKIKSAALGILSWGIQSTAGEVRIVLDNLLISSAGINTNAVDIPFGEISNCRFEIDTPFIINRHISEHAVVLRRVKASEVHDCEFLGGQGCLNFMGPHSLIHDNLFVNRQMVTNHYCVMARGDSSRVYRNRFEPEIGSGLEIFRHNYIEVFDNTFIIEASPPTCEYGHEEYSTTAIRIADYNARPGAPDGCAGNRIYRNKMQITGRDFPRVPDYKPMAWAFFYSTSGGENYVYDNDITVEQRDLGTKAEASAIYIGGGSIGGQFYDNRITTNVPAAWIGNPYGGAAGAVLRNNTIGKSANAPSDFKPIRMGFSEREDCLARDIEFHSNIIQGTDFAVEATGQNHGYSVYWTLRVKLVGRLVKAAAGKEIQVLDREGNLAADGKTDQNGEFSAELLEYTLDGQKRMDSAPYTVKVDRLKKNVELKKNSEIEIIIK